MLYGIIVNVLFPMCCDKNSISLFCLSHALECNQYKTKHSIIINNKNNWNQIQTSPSNISKESYLQTHIESRHTVYSKYFCWLTKVYCVRAWLRACVYKKRKDKLNYFGPTVSNSKEVDDGSFIFLNQLTHIQAEGRK